MNPSFFMKIIDGKLVAWDYRQHNQFEISERHLQRIIAIASGNDYENTKIDNEIRDSRLLDSDDGTRWGWDVLSRIFHIGTQIGLNAGDDLPRHAKFDGYIDFCSSIVDKVPDIHISYPGPVTPLPAYSGDGCRDTAIQDALMRRYSCRCFDGSPVKIQALADVLWLTFGAVHGGERSDLAKFNLMPIGYRRTSPSGGSMHPSEPYVVVMNVIGLDPGLYHYRSDRHELVRIGEPIGNGDLGGLLCGQSFADKLSYGVFLTTRFNKMWWKYPHSRAYRVALLDIGCLIQTFQLVNTALDIQSWPTGYFLDHEINKLLNLDTDIESAMFFLGAGYGSGSVAKEALDALERRAVEGANQ